MNSIILISAPAAGKGTISEYIENKYNIDHISTGDLLREECNKDTQIGKEISNLLNNGSFVDDDIIFSLLKQKIDKQQKDYILDGTPRTVEQAKRYDELVEELGINLSKVIFIDADKEVLEKHVTGRVICNSCNSIYNKFTDNIEDGLCKNCSSKLSKRSDDSIEVFNDRYNTYLNKTKPLIDYYENKGILYTIKNNSDIKYAYEQIDNIFKE